ncbi:MAG: hypothetical protein QXJ75_02610 [Candidatus Bathyarchaeia archaeon]
MEGERPNHISCICGLVLVLASTVAWIYAASYLMPFMGLEPASVRLSFFAALLGASAAFLSGKSRGRLRKIFYEPYFASYLDLLLVFIPLAAIYIFVIQVFVGELPQAKYVIDQITAHPLPLLSSWIFAFTVFKTLNMLYEKTCKLLSQNVPNFCACLGGWLRPTSLLADLDVILDKLKMQRERIAQASAKAQSRSAFLFEKCSRARAAGDDDTAKVYAEECSESRKIAEILLSSQMTLDAIVLRLETVKELGGVADLFHPISGAIAGLAKQLANVMPEVSEELRKMVEETGCFIGVTDLPTCTSLGEFELKGDTQKILAQAASTARRKAQSILPETPTKNVDHWSS